jgi:hypothetical protein
MIGEGDVQPLLEHFSRQRKYFYHDLPDGVGMSGRRVESRR